jgi:predicted nucleotidyltransferase
LITPTDFRALLLALQVSGVEFIVIGGAAATAHGSARLTVDLDVMYRRSRENMTRLATALTPHAPYLRGAPPGLPFRWDVETIRSGLNFTLTTDLGSIDLLGEVAGLGPFDEVLADAKILPLFGVPCPCIDLKHLIVAKRAAGRPKDLEALAELEAILEERGSVEP